MRAYRDFDRPIDCRYPIGRVWEDRLRRVRAAPADKQNHSDGRGCQDANEDIGPISPEQPEDPGA